MNASIARVLPQVRRVRVDDLESIARLSHLVFRRYDPSAVRNVVRMVRNPAAETIVAESDGALAGFAIVHLRRAPRPYGPWSRPVVAHLDAIAVRPESAGTGLGRHLLGTAEEIARAHQAILMSLMTAADNQSAKRLFHAAGYDLVTVLDDAYVSNRGLALQKSLVRP